MDGDDPKLPRGESRALTPGERDIARSVFGSNVNYDEVRIQNGKDGLGWDVANALGSMFGASNTGTRPQVVGNTIYFPQGDYKDDFSKGGGDHTFIHEMTHIWQVQNHLIGTAARTATDVVANGLKYDETYAYRLDAKKDLGDYNLEQQGDIVADFYSWRKRQQSGEKEPSLADDPDGSKYVATVSKFLKETPDGMWRKMALANAAVDIGADGIVHLNPEKYQNLIKAQAQAAEDDKKEDATRLRVMDNFLRNPGYLNPIQGVTKDIIDTTVNAIPSALAAIKKFTIG